MRHALSRPVVVFSVSERLHATGLFVLTFDGGMIAAETVYYDCAQSPVAGRCANMR